MREVPDDARGLADRHYGDDARNKKKTGGAAQALRKLGPPRLATLTLAVYRH